MAILETLKNIFVPPIDEDADEDMGAATPEKKEEKRERKTETYVSDSSAGKKARVVSINAGVVQQIVVVKLDSTAGVKVIIDQLKNKTPVVFNIARLDRDEAKRAVDVVYGASYALDGNMQKVSNDIFVATPHGMEITGDITEKIIGSSEFSWDV